MPEPNSRVLIRGGTVIDPSQKLHGLHDLLVEDGKIASVDKPGAIPEKPGTIVIEAKGQWVLPGLIDVHVHLREPGHEYKETIETGARAAVAGGFASIACMANTTPVNDTPYTTAYIREKARAVATCNVYVIGAVTKGLRGEELAEIGGMVEEGACAISDDGMSLMNSYLMRKAMDYAKAFDVPVISHAEDTHLVGHGVVNEGVLSNELGLRGNPAAAEEIMVAREVALCRLTRSRVHIAHISTQVGLEHVMRAKEAGLPVTAEVTPHHLSLNEDAVRGYNTNFKMAPPLRSEKDRQAMVEGLASGAIDMIATDHAPHGLVDKALEFDQAANGIVGLQTAVPATLALVHEGIISVDRWVESLTLKPAQLIGCGRGTLKKGAIADLTLVDPSLIWTFDESLIASKSRNSPYLGREFKGRVVSTIVSGKVVYQAERAAARRN